MKKVKISKKLMAALKLLSPNYCGKPYRPIFKVMRYRWGEKFVTYYTITTIKEIFKESGLRPEDILYTEIVNLL